MFPVTGIVAAGGATFYWERFMAGREKWLPSRERDR